MLDYIPSLIGFRAYLDKLVMGFSTNWVNLLLDSQAASTFDHAPLNSHRFLDSDQLSSSRVFADKLFSGSITFGNTLIFPITNETSSRKRASTGSYCNQLLKKIYVK